MGLYRSLHSVIESDSVRDCATAAAVVNQTLMMSN